MKQLIYTVNDINKYIKTILGSDENLHYIHVKGEISNCKIASTGHIYFSLKDKDSVINAVMFNNYSKDLTFTPKNGDEVVVLSSIDAYVPRGNYNLFIYEMSLDGQGKILLELEKLKKKLANEGLFDEKRKRPINLFPKKIGIITAPNSAAIKDLIFNINRRYPLVEILFFPSMVQGENAPKQLLEAFNKSQEYDLDTLIIGRGGGSNEDLSAFNDEKLVRAVSNSKMPTISAIGHEIDSTLLDFVVDKRASTPTAAAELATIDLREVSQKIDYIISGMQDSLRNKIKEKEDIILNLKDKNNQLIKLKIDKYEEKIKNYIHTLEALNPTSILKRGYSLTTNEKGEVIVNKNSIKKGDKIITNVIDGKIYSTIDEVK